MRRRLSLVVAVVTTLALVGATTVSAVATFPTRVAVVNKVDIDRNGIDFETERKVDVITTSARYPRPCPASPGTTKTAPCSFR
jgi:hypothetical protein